MKYLARSSLLCAAAMLTPSVVLAQDPPQEAAPAEVEAADEEPVVVDVEAGQPAPVDESAAPASAEPEPPPIDVTVAGTPVSKLAGSGHVVKSKELERFEYDDSHQVLRTVPGVYVRGEDGVGLRPNIGIRGALSDRSKKITLMEDGVLIAPAPYSAPAAYYFPLITRMSQVRVIKGPSAISYGPQTIAGAIDMLTRSIPAQSSGYVDGAVGEYAYGKLHAWAGTSSDDMGFLVEGVHLRSDGFKELPGGEDTGFYRNEWVLKGSYVIDPTAKVPNTLGLKLMYSDELSNETYLGLTDEDFRETPLRRYVASKLDQMRWHRTAATLTHQISPLPNLEITTTAYRNDFSRAWRKLNSFGDRNIADVLANPSAPENAVYYAILTGQLDSTAPGESLLIGPNARDFVSQGIQTKITFDTTSGPLQHRLEYGLRFHYDRAERRHTQDAFLMIGGDLIPAGAPTQTTAENEAWTEAVAFHVLDAIAWKNLTVTPGLRVEVMRSAFVDFLAATETRNSSYAVLPGLGVHYAILPELGVLAGAYRGYSPTAPGSSEQVEPESAINYEGGARYVDGPLLAELIGYYSDYQNLTNICTFSSGCVDANLDQQFDAGRARIYGFEAYATHEVPLGTSLKLPVTGAYTLTQTEFLETFVSQDPIFGSVQSGDEMPYVPEHQASLTLGLESKVAGGYGAVNYVSPMREQAGSAPVEDVVHTDHQFTVDVGAKYRPLEALELYLNVRNVLDAHDIVSRRPYGARPNAPRWTQLGAKLRF